MSRISRPVANSTSVADDAKQRRGAKTKIVECRDRADGAGPSKDNEDPDTKLPPFSISRKEKKTKAADPEKQKRKMIRRNKPQGEDIAKMKQIMKTVRSMPKITVQEFIALVGPSTGDNGELLRTVLNEELSVFRTSTRKIYETMTQDVSDVLTNQNIQLTEHSKEMHDLYSDKMMRNINEIYYHCPDFEFEKYYTQLDYLDDKFPVAKDLEMDEEQEAALLRQEAYHRFQWLKTEGERLKEENSKLQKRLNALKKQQREEMNNAAMREKQAELEREKLANEQEELEEKLEELNDSVEKIIVEQELAAAEEVHIVEKKPKQKKLPTARSRPRLGEPSWGQKAAAQVEAEQEIKTLKSETSKASIRSKKSLTKTKIMKKKVRPPPSGDKSPFHFSPIKSPETQCKPCSTSPFHYSPPRSPGGFQSQMDEAAASRTQMRRGSAGGARPTSPFHYSPPRSPGPSASQTQAGARQTSPFHYSPPRSAAPQAPPSQIKTIVETSTRIEDPNTNTNKYQRGACAPKDSWGGFY